MGKDRISGTATVVCLWLLLFVLGSRSPSERFACLHRGEVSFDKELARGIFGADRGSQAAECVERPADIEGRVAPEYRPLALGIVVTGCFVKDFGGFGEDKEPMSEALRDPEELDISGFGQRLQVEPGPFAEIRRVAAQVNRHVPDMAGEDPDEFALGLTKLVMQPAENPPGGEGLIILNEFRGKTGGGKGILIENFGKPAAAIAKTLRLHQFDVKQRGIEDMHPSSLSGEPER